MDSKQFERLEQLGVFYREEDQVTDLVIRIRSITQLIETQVQ